MTVDEIKEAALFQSQNDIEDIDDFRPVLAEYLDEAYDRLVYAYAGAHPANDTDWPKIKAPGDVPLTPDWTHLSLVDWVTWRILSIGSPAKQQQGMVFRQQFERDLLKAQEEGQGGRANHFINIPR